MELEEPTVLTSHCTTKLQSSRQYGTGTKTEIHINVNKKASPEINPHTYVHFIFDKAGKNIYNGEKTASSISGAGKTGQLHVK